MFHKIAGTRERDIPGHVTHVAQRFLEGIKAFAAESPIIGEVFISMFRFSKHFKVSPGALVQHAQIYLSSLNM